ncbi:hypothetical protein PAAG_04721 [Paracoccidioides lutzii Pb01]|uniref:ATP synthase F(0) complex subunit e, mitochondrial n=1 Tax=Paracoccidioides lutzii (strain ATCC MYA-826 / Pb01) TaxID=502779 RepID=C1H292_PARBA|nr:hypothetical protein PAAG_04721 [Paracoccidioides lutzii Pb01]EEH33672.1 hypothetical protein PAAG_04721 [Paracoccidioides lutzii Pb01]
MATSQGVNVLRYSALFAGVLYGFYHQSTVKSQAKQAQIDREYSRKQLLIEQAKAEYAKKNAPPGIKSTSQRVITDPEDKRFDLEAFINMKAAEMAK